MHRNDFLQQVALIASAGFASSITKKFNDRSPFAADETSVARPSSPLLLNAQAGRQTRLKTSLNAYSFNQSLTAGKMSVDQLLEYCAAQGFDAIDLTGYYFDGYPQIPSDEYIFRIKRKAFQLGIEFSGTGVRNDFTIRDENKLNENVALVKHWIDVAAKLGAPVIRTFAGTQEPPAADRPDIERQVIRCMQQCAAYGKEKGVIVAMQNHNHFIKNAAHVHAIMKGVQNEWFGLVLDIGSYREGDPFVQIADTARYAVNWQIKENMFLDGKEVATDLKKVIDIVRNSGYNGYIPIETLGAGDVAEKVAAMLKKVKALIG